MTFRPLTQSAATLFWSPTPTVFLSNHPSKLRDSNPGLDDSKPQALSQHPSCLLQTQSTFSVMTVPGLGSWEGHALGSLGYCDVRKGRYSLAFRNTSCRARHCNKGNSLASPTRKLLVKTKVLTHTLTRIHLGEVCRWGCE